LDAVAGARGGRGILVIKDVTSILSTDRNVRSSILAALREVHDGRWERNVGSDGGQTLTWQGRIIVVGAVTTAWDTAHGVVSALGDRFILIRIDSTIGRKAAGRRAMRNIGSEIEMRAELAAAVGGLVGQIGPEGTELTRVEEEQLLDIADIGPRPGRRSKRTFRAMWSTATPPRCPRVLLSSLHR
jgi:hypothetical protein